jgi:acyl-CoA thioester hydrolase
MNDITRREGYKVWIAREVLFRDLDAMGHMNNVTPIYYFEDARIVYFRMIADGWDFKGATSILARVECDYLGQAFMGEHLVVAVKAVKVGKKSFTFEYLVSERETSRVVCRGTSVGVCFRYSDQKTCEVPPEFIRELEKIEGRPIL